MGMTTLAQDAVSRRMEALLDLLKATSTDDNVLLQKQVERCKQEFITNKEEEDSTSTTTNHSSSTKEWDEDILSITQQLEECIQETPEKMDDFQPEKKPRVTYKPSKTISTNNERRSSKRPPRPDKEEKKKRSVAAAAAAAAAQPPQAKEQTSSVDRREQLEREFSEMSYPKIGSGYSDTISVVSDLSIPTVVTNLHVNEEELYSDLPPIPQISTLNNPGLPGIQRQASIGSKMMTHPTPDRQDEEEETTLEAPSLVAAPSVAAPSVAAPSVAAPSLAEVPQKRAPGGAAAQRRQTHQAVLAHLQHQSNVVGGGVDTSGSSRRHSTMGTNKFVPSKKPPPTTASLTVNDLPPLNFPKDEPSEYSSAALVNNSRSKTSGTKRRSLLSRGNKYAASVTATSTRMLLASQKQKQAPTPKRLLHRNNKRDTAEQASSPTNSYMDLDGVLTTMNCDIDFIFQELSVLQDSSTPAAVVPAVQQQQQQEWDEESNIGATAKIKYTLNNVAKTLRHKQGGSGATGTISKKIKDANAAMEDSMSWESLNDKEKSSLSVKGDPVLIDEDGFIVQNDSDGFNDPFGPKEDLFASNSFFPAAQQEAKKSRTKRRSTTTTTEHVKSNMEAAAHKSPNSQETKESRIDAVELATKKRIEMLRRLVKYRAQHVSEDSKRSAKDAEELEKLDFVEAETMKQIARLRDRLGASRRELGQE